MQFLWLDAEFPGNSGKLGVVQRKWIRIWLVELQLILHDSKVWHGQQEFRTLVASSAKMPQSAWARCWSPSLSSDAWRTKPRSPHVTASVPQAAAGNTPPRHLVLSRNLSKKLTLRSLSSGRHLGCPFSQSSAPPEHAIWSKNKVNKINKSMEDPERTPMQHLSIPDCSGCKPRLILFDSFDEKVLTILYPNLCLIVGTILKCWILDCGGPRVNERPRTFHEACQFGHMFRVHSATRNHQALSHRKKRKKEQNTFAKW